MGRQQGQGKPALAGLPAPATALAPVAPTSGARLSTSTPRGLRLPEPGDALRNLRTVQRPVSALVRLSRSPDTEPYHARSGLYRFDDPLGRAAPDGQGHADFGVLYLADSIETAFCESVLHGVGLFADGRYQVPRSALAARSVVLFQRPAAPLLTLVDLTGDAVKRAGLTNDISAGDDYRVSQAWARAIHLELPMADGILAMSRQRPGAVCCAVFDRAALRRLNDCPLPDDVVAGLCARFNVEAVG